MARSEQHLAIEIRRQERLHIAVRCVEGGFVTRETTAREQRRFKAERRRIAAMGGLGHGAGIAGEAAAARGRNPDRMGELLRVEPQEMGSGDRRADRPDHAGRVELEVARFDMAGGFADPALDFDSLDQRGERFAAIGAGRFSQRQHRRQRGRQRVRRRSPHRLEIEHVHRHSVEQRGRHRRQTEPEAERRGLRL